MNLEREQKLLLQKANRIIGECPPDIPEVPGCADGHYFSAENLKKKTGFFHIMNWTSSFFTGIVLLAYEQSGDRRYLRWAFEKNRLFREKVFCHGKDTMHDLGFLYSPQCVALYRLTGDGASAEIAVRAAELLSQRFLPEYGVIRAWGRMDDTIPAYVSTEEATCHFYSESQGLAIVDCMMNIPLLYFAAQQTGNPFFSQVANCHAQQTMQHFIRKDGSIYHSCRFGTGLPQGCNYCGYGNESYWARGAAWAVYGYAIAYTYTKKLDYLNVALCLADDFIGHLAENDAIPVWDFKLPPEEEPAKDTSAAAIAANGFLLLAKRTQNYKYRDWAKRIYCQLTESYLNFDKTVVGTLREQNGRHQYTSYGDYFYFELLRSLSDESRLSCW